MIAKEEEVISVENLIKIKNIYKSYGKGSVKNEVLKDTDLNINEGLP